MKRHVLWAYSIIYSLFVFETDFATANSEVNHLQKNNRNFDLSSLVHRGVSSDEAVAPPSARVITRNLKLFQ